MEAHLKHTFWKMCYLINQKDYETLVEQTEKGNISNSGNTLLTRKKLCFQPSLGHETNEL